MAALSTAAIVGGAALGAGAISANAQASAAKKAAGAQVAATEAANRTQKEIFDRQVSLSAPTARAGASAQARQMLMLGYSPDEVKAFLHQSDSAWGGGSFSGSGGGADLERTLMEQNPDMAAFWNRWEAGGAKPGGHRDTFGDFAGYVRAERPDAIARAQSSLSPAGGESGGSDQYGWVDSFSPDEYVRSLPGYDFRVKEGQKALERSAAARGNLFSGGTGIALNRYGQDYATGEWDNQYRRLGQLAGQGSDATGTTIQVAGQYGDAVSGNQIRAGNARASGYQQQGEAWGNFWGNTVPGAIGFGYGQGFFGK